MRNINIKPTLATTTWIAATSSSDNKAMMTGKRRTGYDCTGLISPHVTNGCSRKFLLGIALFVLLASVNGATDQVSNTTYPKICVEYHSYNVSMVLKSMEIFKY
ncbi:uncharacterized protein LOC111591527 isoform X1 [Ceratitis capitata]|uniref:uncharacterized protein LOC111591527 isoform X1 n=1 Tax=Ceratitis capitata TaxID=7213 RepID=UPI000C6C7370|nr:uncharacterized protein LOC111591527 isoform X1 [Ceratitis capitata]